MQSLNFIEKFALEGLADNLGLKNEEIEVYLGKALTYSRHYSNPSKIGYSFYRLTQMFWAIIGQSDWQLARQDLIHAITINTRKKSAFYNIIPLNKNANQAKKFLADGILTNLTIALIGPNPYKKQVIEIKMKEFKDKNKNSDQNVIQQKQIEITNKQIKKQFKEDMLALQNNFYCQFLKFNTANFNSLRGNI